MTEFGFIDRIKDLFATLPDNGFEGIGDDCAVLPVGGGESLVFTTDMLAEGVHFLRTATSARELGRKSLAVNLSDVASMGARPIATLLSLSLPDDATGAWAEEFMQGYRELSQEFGVTLAGGDTTRSAAGITINVTAIGRAADTHIKRRSGARPGDVIFRRERSEPPGRACATFSRAVTTPPPLPYTAIPGRRSPKASGSAGGTKYMP